MEAKLALLESLLGSTDLQTSARQATEWLVANANVRQAAVLMSEPRTGNLMMLAEHGLPSAMVADFGFADTAPAHPLMRAMALSGPASLSASPSSLRSPVHLSTV